MLPAARFALGPLLLRQARVVRRTALRLPEAAGPREGVEGQGEPVVRLLVLGDSSAAGVGVPTQAEALAWPLARLLAERLQGAVAWQLVAETGTSTPGARTLLARSSPAPADVVVTALGVNDVTAQLSAGAFITHTAQLWSDLRQRTGARWGVVCGLPPMGRLTAMPQPLRWYLGRCARDLDAALREWTRRHSLGYCALDWTADPAFLAHDGFHPGPALYPVWARRLADIVVDGRCRWAAAA
jgi:lysophospholipase L1-like esterase